MNRHTYSPDEIAAMTPAERERAQDRLVEEWLERRARRYATRCPPSNGLGGYGPTVGPWETWAEIERIVEGLT